MASINMKLSLEPDIEERPRPLQYHESNQTKLIEEENVLQKELDNFNFAKDLTAYFSRLMVKCYV